ncbi:hypothetical protein [Methanomassiliicoccus luminyensis]|jgi:hypothetical protein|nr:hypothetical protein [Methanomassiliicoccus luminyensis]
MRTRYLHDLYVYALGSMIYMDVILVALIFMYGAFGTWEPR